MQPHVKNGVLEETMEATQISLRGLVDKWLAPDVTSKIRVTQFSRTGPSRRRFIRVETAHSTGTRAIYFFRHGDGMWRVFPPRNSAPHLTIVSSAVHAAAA